LAQGTAFLIQDIEEGYRIPVFTAVEDAVVWATWANEVTPNLNLEVAPITLDLLATKFQMIKDQSLDFDAAIKVVLTGLESVGGVPTLTDIATLFTTKPVSN
jgi:hypothetical protein